MSLTVYAILSVLLLFLASKLFTKFQNASKARAEGLGSLLDPPAPAWDFLGLTFLAGLSSAAWNNEMHTYLDRTFKSLSSKAGTTIRTFVFSRLGSPTIVTLDPVNTNAILVTQFNDFCMGNRAKLLGPVIGVHSIVSIMFYILHPPLFCTQNRMNTSDQRHRSSLTARNGQKPVLPLATPSAVTVSVT